jgi:clan AA aspartic protease
MITGRVDEFGRAIVAVSILDSRHSPVTEIDAWIDTGFNGDLVLPQRLVDSLSLETTGTLKAILADGSEINLERYLCVIDWLGEMRELEVIANAGDVPLLGVGLLLGTDLHISYRTGDIRIED